MIESVQIRNYSDQFYEYSQLVESEQKKFKKKRSLQRNPGWEAVDKAKFYIGITVPNQKNYIYKKKREKKKRREKKKKNQIYIYIYISYWNRCTGTPSKCTGTTYSKTDSEQSVPVHHLCVPVHPMKKEAVANVYRYTIKVYRYTWPIFGQMRLLT